MAAKTLLKSLFLYKSAADTELVEAMTALPAGVAGFGPALRVLDHAHAVDRIFSANLQGAAHDQKASRSAELPSLMDLAASIRETDDWYLEYISKMKPDEIEEAVEFKFTDGQKGRMSRAEILAHVITHSGYHRGEIGRLLPEIGTVAARDVFAGYLHRAEPQRRQ